MSLIREALKRAEQKQEAAYVAEPDRSRQPSVRRRVRMLPYLLVAVAMVAAVLLEWGPGRIAQLRPLPTAVEADLTTGTTGVPGTARMSTERPSMYGSSATAGTPEMHTAASTLILARPVLPAKAEAQPPQPNWASFQLGGVMFGHLEPTAIVNGQLVREGDIVDGARVTRIGAEHVDLSAEGQTHRLQLR